MVVSQDVAASTNRIPLKIELMENGSFMATSTALEGFLVVADNVNEVIALAPVVAKALIEAMREKGIPQPLAVEKIRFPIETEVLII